MENSKIILVVNADDFGLHQGINLGIESSFRQGILRSASLMPNGAAFDDALLVAARNPELGIGIHISLVGEKCVAPAASLGRLVNENGDLPQSYLAFVKGLIQRRFSLPEIRIEISAQIKKAITSGIRFTHIDSHQHLHMMPGILEMVIDAAHAAGISFIRLPFENGGITPNRFSVRGVQLSSLSVLSRARSSVFDKAAIKHANHFWGLGLSGMLNESNLMQTLSLLRPGINEIMCHPGVSDSATRLRYSWGYMWDEEGEALQAERVKRFVADNNIRLANFQQSRNNISKELSNQSVSLAE